MTTEEMTDEEMMTTEEMTDEETMTTEWRVAEEDVMIIDETNGVIVITPRMRFDNHSVMQAEVREEVR